MIQKFRAGESLSMLSCLRLSLLRGPDRVQPPNSRISSVALRTFQNFSELFRYFPPGLSSQKQGLQRKHKITKRKHGHILYISCGTLALLKSGERNEPININNMSGLSRKRVGVTFVYVFAFLLGKRQTHE